MKFISVRPGEPPTAEAAANYFNNAYFDDRRYSLSKVGRYKLTKKLSAEIDKIEDLFGIKLERPAADSQVLTRSEVLAAISYLLHLANANPATGSMTKTISPTDAFDS